MRPRAIAALVAVLALAGLVYWFVSAPSRGSRSGSREASAAHSAEGEAASGFGGVASRDADPSTDAKVRARVVDEDGQPVTEGVVELACLSGDSVQAIRGAAARLDDDGSFALQACRDRVCVAFRHPYLVPAQPWVLDAHDDAELVARRLPRLHGEVFAGADPLVDAKVTFLPPEGSEDDPTAMIPLASRSTSTDADGRFSVAWIQRPPCGPCEEAMDRCHEELSLHAGVRAVVTADGHAATTVAIEPEARAGQSVDEPVRIEVPAAADLLTGSLRDLEGAVFPRAYVLARSVERPHDQRRAEVFEGNFEIDGLGTGEYGLRAIQDGVEIATSVGEAGDDVELRSERSAQGPDMVVTVVGADGRPVEGAAAIGGPFSDARTDMKGQVRAPNALSGSFVLRVRAGARQSRTEIEVPASDAEQMIQIRVELPS